MFTEGRETEFTSPRTEGTIEEEALLVVVGDGGTFGGKVEEDAPLCEEGQLLHGRRGGHVRVMVCTETEQNRLRVSGTGGKLRDRGVVA